MKPSLIALIASGCFTTGTGTIIQPTLGTLTFTPVGGTLVAGSLTAGQVVATISGKTAGSTLFENSPYVDVSGSSVVLTTAGAALGAGSYTTSVVETLVGAIGSPRSNDFQMVIEVAPVSAGTLNLQSVGTLSLVGVTVNPVNKLANSATITAGNTGTRFAISNGYITIAATLSSGPYTLTISGDPNYTTVVVPTEANKYTVTSVAELLAAYAVAPVGTVGTTSSTKIEIPDGVTLQQRSLTDTSQVDASFTIPTRAFTATLTDPNYGLTKDQIALNQTATASYTNGGYVEITCRTPWAGRIDQRMLFAASVTGVIFSNIAFVGTVFVTTQVGGPKTLLADNTVYTGGYGYDANDTWTWSDGNGAVMSGSVTVAGFDAVITATGSGYTVGDTWSWADPLTSLVYSGVIDGVDANKGITSITKVKASGLDNRGAANANASDTLIPVTLTTGSGITSATGTGGQIRIQNHALASAPITSKNALVEDAIGRPIKLVNASTGNGIRTSGGVGGTIFLCHDNYVEGSPAGSNYFFQTTNGINNVEILASGNNLSTQAQVIWKNCFWGGYLTKPGKPSQWRGGLNARFVKRIVIEDCTFKGIRNALGVQECPEAVVRRCDFQLQLEDGIRFFDGGLVQHNSITVQRAIVHGNAFHNNYYGSDFSSYHSDAIQFGSPNDGFDHYGIVFNNRIVFPRGTTQGIYNDDSFDVPNGNLLETFNNLVITSAQDQRPVFRSWGTGDIIKNETYLKGPMSAGTVGRFPIRGGGLGVAITNTIYGEVSDQTYLPFGGYTIQDGGTGFAVNDRISYTDAFGQYGYGTITQVSATGGVVKIVWDRNPAGVVNNFVMDTTLKNSDGSFKYIQVLSKFPNPVQGRNVSRSVFTNAGRGLKITILGDTTNYVAPATSSPQNQTWVTQSGFATITVTNSQSLLSYTANTGAGDSYPENFVGPFTRFDGLITNYSLNPPAGVASKGWDFDAALDHTNRATLFATVDAVFTPKAGSLSAGRGHLVP